MWDQLKRLGRSWFFLTSGEQQAVGLLILLLLLGLWGRWGYARLHGAPASAAEPAGRHPTMEIYTDE